MADRAFSASPTSGTSRSVKRPLISDDEEQPLVVGFQHASLSSSTPSLSSSGTHTLVLRQHADWVREQQTLEQRWPSIGVARNYTATHGNAIDSTISETLITGQGTLAMDSLIIGLGPLKEWVRRSVQRVLVPPSNTMHSIISANTPPDALCVTVSPDASGIRSYVEGVCRELRIECYTISPTTFHGTMIEELLTDAIAVGRSVILFDRCQWFLAGDEYNHRGVAVMAQLEARMQAQRIARRSASPARVMENSLTLDTLGSLVPGLWIVISTTFENIAPAVLSLSPGCLFKVTHASQEVAEQMIVNTIQARLRNYTFPDAEVKAALAANKANIVAISASLAHFSPGKNVSIITRAIVHAAHRVMSDHNYTQVASMMIPTTADVVKAKAEILQQQAQTEASHAAMIINGRQ